MTFDSSLKILKIQLIDRIMMICESASGRIWIQILI